MTIPNIPNERIANLILEMTLHSCTNYEIILFNAESETTFLKGLLRQETLILEISFYDVKKVFLSCFLKFRFFSFFLSFLPKCIVLAVKKPSKGTHFCRTNYPVLPRNDATNHTNHLTMASLKIFCSETP